MKIISPVLFFMLFVCFKADAQAYEVPKNYKFKSNADYARYEPDILKTVDWMQLTSWTEEPKKTDEAIQFFLDWVRGTPAVTVNLGQASLRLSDKNPQLGFTYMAQYAKYALLHKDHFDHTKANLEALRAVITKYYKEPTHKKDDDIEMLMSLEQKGQLEQWIITDFEQQQQ
ncbi:hypothetical protein FFF34_000670 [Inquilinus sp. KBS0705]|nr:hypothetical protein FFF34_000670 [Inquilinus sp. KBS0705]